MNLQELFSKAIDLYKSGNTAEANQHCLHAIQLQPAFADAYNLSGLIARDNKDYSTAIRQFRKALQIQDKNAVYLTNLAQSLLLSDKEEDAVKSYTKALSVDPFFIPALLQYGKYCRSKNKLEEAERLFEKILEKKPDHAGALNNLGNVYQMQNKQKKAMELYSKALLLYPEIPELHFNFGNVLFTSGQTDEAEKHLIKSIELNPAFNLPYTALAKLAMYRRQLKQAKEYLLTSLKIKPNDSEALFMLANYYRSNGEIEEAVVYYKRTIQYHPEHAMAHNNLGMTYFSIGMNLETEEHFTKAIEIAPDCSEALYGMAKLMENEKKYHEAYSFFEKTVALSPPFLTQVLFDFFLLKARILDWKTYEEDIATLKKKVVEYINNPEQLFQLSPLTLNYFPVEKEIHKAVAEKYASIIKAEVAEAKTLCNFTFTQRDKEAKIRIGYLSADLRFHAVGMLLNQLFSHHDKSKFEVYAYSIINNDDEYNKIFKEGADVFRDITKQSYVETARLIHKDNIDVLIDLGGYTTYTRTQIMALQPAPVQMHFMGYPDTMGADFIQYIIADKYLIPEEDQPYYTEKVLYTNHAFFSSPFKVSERKMSRAEFGLPENAFVYCCYNSYHKISPDVFDTWMDILHKTENTVLWITKENDIGVDNLLAVAKQKGIHSDRIVFAERLPMEEYLASYSCADLFLDTFNYSAGSTAICALWGEVPVLTYTGNTNSARMGSSIVHATGLDDFICNSKEEYISKAIQLSKKKEKTDQAKRDLKNKKTSLPLFDLKTSLIKIEIIINQMLRK